MNISIRLATLADVPELQKLIDVSVRGLSVEYYTPNQIASGLTYVFGVDTQLILDETYFVAEVEQQIVGSGGWSKRKTLFGGDQSKSDLDPLLDPELDAARIRAFYVDPHWARKGIGSRILTACEDAASRAGFKQVELVATLPGEPLYSSRGYQRAEPMEITTPEGNLPAFRMTKSIG
jgi:N-acetylglutamate synthase-like GNAT family acetyltransferase